MKKFFFAAAVAALALVACERTDNVVVSQRQAVKFSVENIGTYTMKSVAITESEGLSQVGIFASELGASNVAATISGTNLTPASTIYWAAGQAEDAAKSFVAYYPYAENREVNSTDFLPKYNQDSGEVDYSAFNNFVTAVKSAAPNTEDGVQFSFAHPFAKMIINVVNQLGSDAIKTEGGSGIAVSGINLGTAIDISTSPVTVTLADETSTVYPYAITANEKYEFVLLPQTAAPTITITTVKGSVYTFTISSDYTFEAGKVAVANLTLSNSASSGESDLNPVSFENVIDLTNAAWDDDNATAVAITPGDVTVSEDYWYLILAPWTTDLPMTNNGINGDGQEEWMITFDYTAGTEFKVRQNKAWDNNFGGTAVVGSDFGAVSSGNNLSLTDTGNYTLYLKLKEGNNEFYINKN